MRNVFCLLLLLPAVVQAQFNFVTNGGSLTITRYTGSGGPVVVPDMTNGLPVTSIGGNAFENKTSVTSVTLGTNITSIGYAAFRWCHGLTNVTFSPNLASVDEYGFYGCSSLVRVAIPGSLTTIGPMAFACISAPASLIAIDVDTNNPAFCSVDGVLFNKSTNTLIQCPVGKPGNYTVPETVTSIGYGAFYYCAYLTSVTIPNSVTSIESLAFANSSLTSVTIGTNVTSIGYCGFFDCNNLTSVMIPASVTSLEKFALGPCASMTNIVVATNNPAFCSVDGVLFNKSTNILVQFPAGLTGSYTIPSGVTFVGDGAFYVCDGLTNVTAPASLTGIGEQGFAFCYALTGLCLPGNAPSIGWDAFYVTPVTIYYLPSTSGWVGTTHGGRLLVPAYPQITAGPQNRTDSVGSSATLNVTVTGAAELTYQWSKDGTDLLNNGDIVGAKNATLIINNLKLEDEGEYQVLVTNAFGSVSTGAVLTVTLSSPVADFNFYTNGGSITINGYKGPGGAVIIPDSISGLPVTSVASYAFYSSATLARVTIPNSVTSVESYAFYFCPSLTNVIIGSGLTNLNSFAFNSCDSLSTFTADNDNPVFASEAGILFDKSLTTLLKYPMGLPGSYTIPNRVTALGVGAFSGCAALTGITIPGTITSISESAFESCGGLTNVMIPGSVTNIGNMAFSSCSSLTDITIPDSVLSIGDSAFNYCTSLANIIIPAGVLSIGNNAFNGCESLASVTIPESVTGIGLNAFGFCTSLTAIQVDPKNPSFSSAAGVLFNKDQSTLILCPTGKAGNYAITNICTSIADNAFGGCANLTLITIPNSVTSIGGWAFSGCSGLTSITLPDGITSIGMGTFEGCSALTSISIRNTVTSIENMAFNSCSSLTNITIPASVTTLGFSAFGWCGNLKEVYFLGNAPDGMFVFFGADAAMAYYLAGTTGWGPYIGGMSPDMGGIPTALWNPTSSVGMQLPGTNFGEQSNHFGFIITGSSDQEVVVEACTSLTNPEWVPIYTNILTSGSLPFSDPNWTTYPDRFYRVRSQ
jgi:hypothetical protein